MFAATDPIDNDNQEWGLLSVIAAAAQNIRYPLGIHPVPHEIDGPAFFPGGRRLVSNDMSKGRALPVGGGSARGAAASSTGEGTKRLASGQRYAKRSATSCPASDRQGSPR